MIRQVTFGLLLVASLARAAESTAALTVAGIQEFTIADQAWDGPGFAKAADWFEQACAQAPDAAVIHYWKGVAEFHQLVHLWGSVPRAGGKELARRTKQTIRALSKAVELNERDGESHALLATAYGLNIAASPARAAWLGPRVTKHQKRALEHGANNPRVHYLIGMNCYHGPGILGGKVKALEHLRKAEELFAREAGQSLNPMEPRWGRSSCLTFLGKTYDALRKSTEAEQCFRRALEINPQHPLAREELEQRRP